MLNVALYKACQSLSWQFYQKFNRSWENTGSGWKRSKRKEEKSSVWGYWMMTWSGSASSTRERRKKRQKAPYRLSNVKSTFWVLTSQTETQTNTYSGPQLPPLSHRTGKSQRHCDHPHATLSAMPTPQDRPNTSHSLVTTTYFSCCHSHTRPKTKTR